MESKKLLNEEIFVIPSESKNRVHVVRPERYGISDWHAQISIRGNTYEVLNYSSFGLAITAENFDPKLKEGVLKANLSIGAILVQELELIYAYETKFSPGVIKIAFEVHGNSLDAEKANAVIEALSIAQSFDNKIAEDAKFDPEFRRVVLEVRDFLSEIRNSLLELENQWRYMPPEIKSAKERGVGLVLAQFLDNSLYDYYKTVALIMKKIEGKEKLAYLNFFRKKIMDLILVAPFVNRAFTKPLGYAGDFEMMNQIYRDDYEGDDLFAKCLHKYYIDQSAAKAVKNRSGFLVEKIVAEIKHNIHGQPIKILSVASGPALEVQLMLEKHVKNLPQTEFTLLDQDLKSLQFAQLKLREATMRNNISNVSFHYRHSAIKNLVVKGMQENNTYHLIYSAGLFDYLSDSVAIACMKQLFLSLLPGGKMIIGNFDVSNPNRSHMEMALDWNLIYRTKDDMIRLATNVCSSVSVESESEGVNLFVTLSKSIV